MRSVFLRRPTAEELAALHPGARFLLVWAPPLAGVAVVMRESTPKFSAVKTSSWLRPIFERFFGAVSNPAWEEYHHIFRKTGHFAGYGTLCVLFLRGWLLALAPETALGERAWRWRSLGLGVLATFLVASGDELHQSFLPSRTGLFSDVVLDTCGGLVVSGMVLGVSWAMRRAGWRGRNAAPP